MWKVWPQTIKTCHHHHQWHRKKKWYRLVEEEIHSRLTSLSIAINPWSHMDGWKSELLLRWQEMCSSSYYYYFTYYIVVFETSAQWAKTLKKLKLWYLLFTWLFGPLCSKRMSNNFVFNSATKTLFFKINIFLCLCSLCPLRLLLWLLSIMAGSDSLMVVVTKWEACNRLTRGH